MKYPTAHLAQAAPNRTAVIEGDQRVSHAELERRIVEAAGQLCTLGVRPQNRVALLAPNSIEWIVIAHAVARVGAILVPLSTRLAVPEISALLEFFSPRVLLMDRPSDPALSEVRPVNCSVVHMGKSAPHSTQSWSIVPPSAEEINTEVDPHRLCTIISTSGTTGRPKGVCLSLANHLAAAEASARNLDPGPHDCWLINLPLYHIGGLAVIYRACLGGFATRIHSRFDAQRTADAIDRDGITHLSLVENTLLRLLEARGERRFPPTLRAVLVGGGPVAGELLRRARELGMPVLPTYGLTEAASQVATMPPDTMTDKMETVGRPLPGCEIQIRDEYGKPVPVGVAGEITIRGPMVTQGYWTPTTKIEPISSDGWFATGDIGVLDDKGLLAVCGRANDMIISGGEKIFPAEIEDCLTQWPGIRVAVVIGEDSPSWGQVPIAFIELIPGASVRSVDLTATLSNKLAHYKIPKRFIVLDRIPLTGSGKIDRRRLAGLSCDPMHNTQDIS